MKMPAWLTSVRNAVDDIETEDVQDWLWVMRQIAPLLPYAVPARPLRVVTIPEQRRGIDGHR